MIFSPATQFLTIGLVVTALAHTESPPVISRQNGVSCACTQLSTQYEGSVLFQDSANYTAETTAYWDVRSDMSPRCIFLPTSADQVANAVSIFASCGAEFAVRGGGHMNVSSSMGNLKGVQ